MAWIESSCDLPEHPKTLELSTLTGYDIDTVLGKLHRFWYWVLKFAEDGDLRKFNDEQLGRAVGLNGSEAKKFIESMVEARWLDREPYFRVHDWWEYIGLFMQRKYGDKNKEKWLRIQRLYKSCTESSTPIDATNLTNLTNLTKHNNTDFDAIWARYPNRQGKKAAERHFEASVKTPEDFDSINKALDNYLKCDTVKKGFVKHGSTWFNDWQSWINPTKEMMDGPGKGKYQSGFGQSQTGRGETGNEFKA